MDSSSNLDFSPTQPSVEALAGSFGFAQLTKAGAATIAEKIFRQVSLTESDALEIASFELPVIMKLVEIYSSLSPSPAANSIRLRPVYYLPLAELLETSSPQAAIERGQAAISELNKKLNFSGTLYVAIDRWTGAFALQELLACIKQIIALPLGETRSLRALGATTLEIEEISTSSKLTFPELAKLFQEAGIFSIEGGAELSVHKDASDFGFELVVAQRLPESTEFHYKDFITELFHISRVLAPGGNLRVWFPWSQYQLDSVESTRHGVLGLDFLKCIALGRLVLKDVPMIRAPISLLGVKLASVALSLGANDLGFAAVESGTAEKLGIARMSETQEAIGESEFYSNVVVG